MGHFRDIRNCCGVYAWGSFVTFDFLLTPGTVLYHSKNVVFQATRSRYVVNGYGSILIQIWYLKISYTTQGAAGTQYSKVFNIRRNRAERSRAKYIEQNFWSTAPAAPMLSRPRETGIRSHNFSWPGLITFHVLDILLERINDYQRRIGFVFVNTVTIQSCPSVRSCVKHGPA